MSSSNLVWYKPQYLVPTSNRLFLYRCRCVRPWPWGSAFPEPRRCGTCHCLCFQNSLTAGERVLRKELLSVVFGLKKFRPYLMGKHFVVRVDHASIQWLRKTPAPLAQTARWLLFVEQYDFEVQHGKGENTETLMPFHVDLTFASSVKRSSQQS